MCATELHLTWFEIFNYKTSKTGTGVEKVSLCEHKSTCF